jgi:hypothetical protein
MCKVVTVVSLSSCVILIKKFTASALHPGQASASRPLNNYKPQLELQLPQANGQRACKSAIKVVIQPVVICLHTLHTNRHAIAEA